MRDAIFGQYNTRHALIVDIGTDRASKGFRGYLENDDLPLSGRVVLTSDGSIASIARRTSVYLRHDYQAALRHLLAREGVRKVLLLSAWTSAIRRRLVARLDPADRPVIFLLFCGVLPAGAFGTCSLLDLGSYY